MLTRVGGCPPFVDAHLAGADHAVDVRLGHALEEFEQEIVEPLAFGAFVDRDLADLGLGGRLGSPISRGRRGVFGPYNLLHHVAAVSG